MTNANRNRSSSLIFILGFDFLSFCLCFLALAHALFSKKSHIVCVFPLEYDVGRERRVKDGAGRGKGRKRKKKTGTGTDITKAERFERKKRSRVEIKLSESERVPDRPPSNSFECFFPLLTTSYQPSPSHKPRPALPFFFSSSPCRVPKDSRSERLSLYHALLKPAAWPYMSPPRLP